MGASLAAVDIVSGGHYRNLQQFPSFAHSIDWPLVILSSCSDMSLLSDKAAECRDECRAHDLLLSTGPPSNNAHVAPAIQQAPVRLSRAQLLLLFSDSFVIHGTRHPHAGLSAVLGF